jgi:hypothetical protein
VLLLLLCQAALLLLLDLQLRQQPRQSLTVIDCHLCCCYSLLLLVLLVLLSCLSAQLLSWQSVGTADQGTY